MNQADEDGATALHMVCASKHTKVEAVVRTLVAARASVSAVDKSSTTALMRCAIHGAEKAALQLADAGANIDARDGDGNTPLHLATMHDHEKLVQLFLQHAVRCSGLAYKRQEKLVQLVL